MKRPRKPKDLNYFEGKEHVIAWSSRNGFIEVSAEIKSGKAIIKLIYWLMRYRIWQCR